MVVYYQNKSSKKAITYMNYYKSIVSKKQK